MSRKQQGHAVAVTGGIGCGKSEVGRLFKALGAAVRDTDDIARELTVAGHPVLQQIAAHFGADVLDETGALRRGVLARRVFSNAAERQVLNGMLHPEIRRIWQNWVKAQRADGRMTVVLIPLLFEVEDPYPWDAVVCVSADQELVLQRLEERGMSREDVLARMAAQMDLKEKEKRADVVIQNDGTTWDLKQKIDELFKEIHKETDKHV